jgi:hypothetical protein
MNTLSSFKELLNEMVASETVLDYKSLETLDEIRDLAIELARIGWKEYYKDIIDNESKLYKGPTGS